MKTKAILLLTLMLSFTTFSQDTTWVQTFTFDSISSRRADFTFPSELDTMRFEKVLMYYKLKCDPATPWDQYNCGEWDYLAYTRIYDHTGQMDSVQVDSVQYLHNYNSTSPYSYEPYTATRVDEYQRLEQTRTGDTSFINPINTTTGATTPLPFDVSSNGNTYQMLLTASELISAGFAPGNIEGLHLELNSIIGNGELWYPTISVKSTTDTDLTSFHHNGFTEVYNLSRVGAFSELVSGTNKFLFYQSYVWNGTDNLILEFRFESPLGGQSNALFFNEGTSNGNDAINYNGRNGVMNFDGNNHALFELSDINIGDDVTIAFWAKGLGNSGVNTSILEGYDTLNNRVLNIHMPWSNNRIYWDAGQGSGYDRIDKDMTGAGIDNEWHHWAFVKSTTTGEMKIFRDGTLWHSGTGLNSPIGDLHRLAIGSNRSIANNWTGKVDEFQLYNVALDDATINSWYQERITNAHPNWNDLLVYYNFDNETTAYDQSSNDYLLMPSSLGMIDFSERPLVDAVSAVRPKIALDWGSVSGAMTNEYQSYYTLKEPEVVFEFAQVDHHFEIINAFRGMTEGSEDVYDENNTVISSVPFSGTATLNNSTITYFEEPFEVINDVEIGRFITPYGISFDLGPNGFTWIYDITDYQQYLSGIVDLAAHNTQELIDLKFAFIEGIPPRDVHNRRPIWSDRKSYTYAAMDNDVVLSATPVQLADSSEMFKIKTRFTGHGHNGNNNCCEWGFGAGRDHEILVDGVSRFNWEIWEETACGDNPNVSQGGTWPYAREGWCPGDLVKEYDHELTPFVTPGTSVTLDYDITDVPANDLAQGNGNYVVAMDLISYGAPNFQIDAAVVDILNPNSWEYYRKWNPSCQNPRVIIQNTGEQTLTSARVTVWVDYFNQVSFDWTGNLEFLEKEIVEIPINDITFWYDNGGEGTFSAHIDHLNQAWGTDEYDQNNTITIPFQAPEAISGEFLVWFTTNNKAFENQWRLTDGQGNTIFERTSLSNSTDYKDTFNLTQGCYSIIIEDSDNDGISFWYSSQTQGETAGSFRIKLVGGPVVEIFEQDFGNYHQYNFTVDVNLGVENLEDLETTLEVYPNPSTDMMNVELLGNVGGEASMVIRDLMGREILKETMNVQKSAANAYVDVTGFSPGTYFVTVTTDHGSFTTEFIKQ